MKRYVAENTQLSGIVRGSVSSVGRDLEFLAESSMLHCNNKGEALDHTAYGWRDLMAGLALNLTNSVANVRRQLLRMMDAIAETGMRRAHKEISRAKEISPAGQPAVRKKRNNRDTMH